MTLRLSVDAIRLQKRLDAAVDKFPKELERQLNSSGNQILNKSRNRFSSRFTGPKTSKIAAAIASSGVKVKTTRDEESTLLIADMDQLDKLTRLPPAKSTGNIFHLWRILHEGSGLLAEQNNPHISGNSNTPSYNLQVIVQTSVLEPFFSPGRHPPFFELVTLDGIPGIIILRSGGGHAHQGFTGHQWFLNNLKLFDTDATTIRNAVAKAVKKVLNQ